MERLIVKLFVGPNVYRTEHRFNAYTRHIPDMAVFEIGMAMAGKHGIQEWEQWDLTSMKKSPPLPQQAEKSFYFKEIRKKDLTLRCS